MSAMIADRLLVGLGCSMGCGWDRFHKWFTFTRYPGEVTFIEWEITLGPLYVSWWRKA